MVIHISEEEENLIELGYVIGFFEGEGGFSVSEFGDVSCNICQKDKSPLIRIQKILEKRKISSYIYLNKKGYDKRLHLGVRYLWVLQIRVCSILDFTKLIEGFMGDKKEKEREIVEKLILYRLKYRPLGNHYAYKTIDILGKLIKEWRDVRTLWKNEKNIPI